MHIYSLLALLYTCNISFDMTCICFVLFMQHAWIFSLLQVLPSLVADSGTLADEDTKEDKMSKLIEVAAANNFGLRTDLKEVRNLNMSVVNVL